MSLLEGPTTCLHLFRSALGHQGYHDSQRRSKVPCSRPRSCSRRTSCRWRRRKLRDLLETAPKGSALFLARKEEEDFELRGLMWTNDREPSTPTPPNGSREAPSPESALFPPEWPPLSIPRGAVSKTTKTRRRPSSGPRKAHCQFLSTAGVSSHSTRGPPPLPQTAPPFLRKAPSPLKGIAGTR